MKNERLNTTYKQEIDDSYSEELYELFINKNHNGDFSVDRSIEEYDKWLNDMSDDELKDIIHNFNFEYLLYIKNEIIDAIEKPEKRIINGEENIILTGDFMSIAEDDWNNKDRMTTFFSLCGKQGQPTYIVHISMMDEELKNKTFDNLVKQRIIK